MEKLKFDDRGLIPVVVQDYYTKRVLTLAYMNRESLEISMREKRTCFFSRSRRKLWRKGESSGNVQHIVSIESDCDGDALLVEVIKDGPACHLGTDSCFDRDVPSPKSKVRFSLQDLTEIIRRRKEHPTEGSYTCYLFERGLDKILKKVGEEATEVVIAAKNRGTEELRRELADLVYHCLVLMVEKGLSPHDVLEELDQRHAGEYS